MDRERPLFQIRLANASDARGIAEVNVESWRKAYQGVVPQEHLNGLSVIEKTSKWANSLASNREQEKNIHTLVLEVEGSIKGYAVVGPARDEIPSDGELYAIYIHPDFYGQGGGEKLLDECRKVAKLNHWKTMGVWFFESNKIGAGFYQKMGAEPLEGQSKVVNIGGLDLTELLYVLKA